MREPKYKIIALDLDGTLLNSRKELSAENLNALQMAAEAGVEIVPTTGRYYLGMPEIIRNLPFLHYAITVNGARVEEISTGRAIYQAEIPNDEAISIMAYLDKLPVYYDCYKDNTGWVTRSMQERAAEFAPDERVLRMLIDLRTPVDELKAFLREQGGGIQKIQIFAKTPALRDAYQQELETAFPAMSMTSAIVNNLEINVKHANKGSALRALAEELQIPIEQTMAFGDGTNDLSMLQVAGCGIAMKNGAEIVRQAADVVTDSCDDDGVAHGIAAYLF